MLSVAAVVRAFHVVATCANPRLASLARRPCRSVLEPHSPRSLFAHVCLVSPLRAAGQPTPLVFSYARAHSGIEHTSAVSTVTVRDPRDQPSSSPRATSSRRPCITVFLFVVFTREPPCHSAHGLTRDQSSHRSATPPLQEETTVCRFHDVSV